MIAAPLLGSRLPVPRLETLALAMAQEWTTGSALSVKDHKGLEKARPSRSLRGTKGPNEVLEARDRAAAVGREIVIEWIPSHDEDEEAQLVNDRDLFLAIGKATADYGAGVAAEWAGDGYLWHEAANADSGEAVTPLARRRATKAPELSFSVDTARAECEEIAPRGRVVEGA